MFNSYSAAAEYAQKHIDDYPIGYEIVETKMRKYVIDVPEDCEYMEFDDEYDYEREQRMQMNRHIESLDLMQTASAESFLEREMPFLAA